MKKQGNTTQSKEQKKSPEIDSKEREVHKLLDKKLNIAITINMHSELRKSMNEQNESNNQDTENIKIAKQKFGTKKLKNPLEGFQSRFDQADKENSETEDRLFEIILFRNNTATERMKNA